MSSERKARWNGSPISSIVDRRIKELGLRGFKEFAERAQIPYTTFYNVARGKKAGDGSYTFYRPSMDTLPALAQALKLREDEVTYLFTVVADDRGAQRPDSPLFEPIEAAMLNQLRAGEDGLYEYAQMNGICPEVLEIAYYGGRDSNGRLAQPPVGTLQDIARATQQDWFRFMNLYARHPNSNHMFFTEEDIAEMQMLYVIGADRRRATGSGPKVFEYKVTVAGVLKSEQVDRAKRQHQAYIWLDEDFIQGRNLAVFRVAGDGMEGGKRPIFDGDLLIVDRDDKGHEATPVVARLRSGGYVCKLLKDDPRGKSLIGTNFTSTDETSFQIFLDEIEKIEGRVIEVRRSEDLRKKA